MAFVCQNPSCNSHGKSHPNCKCWVPSAEGGEVSHFCSESRMHEGGCAYMAEGGFPSFDQTEPALPSFDETSPVLPSFEDTQPTKQDKYGTPGQQAVTALEGGAKGFAGPLATLAETKLLGVPKEDILGRAEVNPFTHGATEAAGLGAGFLTGTGEAGLIAKGVTKVLPNLERAGMLAKAGANALKAATESGMIQGGDEVSNAILGQGNSYPVVASHIAEAGAIGLFTGGLFGATQGALASKSATQALEAIENQRLGSKARAFMAGIGAASEASREADEVTKAAVLRNARTAAHVSSFDSGVKFFDQGMSKVSEKLAKGIAAPIGGVIGSHIAGIPGAIGGYKLAKDYLEGYVAKLLDKPLSSATKKYVFPMMLKAMSAGKVDRLWNVLDDASKISKGAIKINNSVEGLFKAGAAPFIDVPSDKDREKLENFITDGGVQPKVAEVLQNPEQDSTNQDHGMDFSQIQGRVSSYLSNLRPQPKQGLPLDTVHEDPQKTRQYKRAVDIALQPLSVLEKVRKGTITQHDMHHFVGMYPELHRYLGEKIQSKLIDSMLDDKKPNYETRQGLSLFMGSPLDSTMTPSSIQAAQEVFSVQKAGQPAPAKPKKASSTSGEKLAQSYLTQEQAAQKRQTSTRP